MYLELFAFVLGLCSRQLGLEFGPIEAFHVVAFEFLLTARNQEFAEIHAYTTRVANVLFTQNFTHTSVSHRKFRFIHSLLKNKLNTCFQLDFRINRQIIEFLNQSFKLLWSQLVQNAPDITLKLRQGIIAFGFLIFKTRRFPSIFCFLKLTKNEILGANIHNVNKQLSKTNKLQKYKKHSK